MGPGLSGIIAVSAIIISTCSIFPYMNIESPKILVSFVISIMHSKASKDVPVASNLAAVVRLVQLAESVVIWLEMTRSIGFCYRITPVY